MMRFMFRDIDSLNTLTLVTWLGRILFMMCFGMTFAVVTIFARWSLVTERKDKTVEYTVIRLQAENDQLREAIGAMQRQMRPVKQGVRNVGGEETAR